MTRNKSRDIGERQLPWDKRLSRVPLLHPVETSVIPAPAPLDATAPGVFSPRLLNLDVDMWVHLNCALWSQEVYETVNGALMNVASACRRAVLLTCCCCQRTGASLRCFRLRCTAAYHFPCAAKDGCSFFKDKARKAPLPPPLCLLQSLGGQRSESVAFLADHPVSPAHASCPEPRECPRVCGRLPEGIHKP